MVIIFIFVTFSVKEVCGIPAFGGPLSVINPRLLSDRTRTRRLRLPGQVAMVNFRLSIYNSANLAYDHYH